MQFIEMSGKTLLSIIDSNDGLMPDLSQAGVTDDTIVRINQHGDIEVRRAKKWDVIGGLLGDYIERVKAKTGLDFA